MQLGMKMTSVGNGNGNQINFCTPLSIPVLFMRLHLCAILIFYFASISLVRFFFVSASICILEHNETPFVASQ